MKQCPKCGFIVTDADPSCFNCGLKFPSAEDKQHELKQSSIPNDIAQEVPEQAQPEQPQKYKQFCSRCGKPNTSKGKFCVVCGNSLLHSTAQPEQAQPEQPQPIYQLEPSPTRIKRKSNITFKSVIAMVLAIILGIGIGVFTTNIFTYRKYSPILKEIKTLKTENELLSAENKILIDREKDVADNSTENVIATSDFEYDNSTTVKIIFSEDTDGKTSVAVYYESSDEYSMKDHYRIISLYSCFSEFDSYTIFTYNAEVYSMMIYENGKLNEFSVLPDKYNDYAQKIDTDEWIKEIKNTSDKVKSAMKNNIPTN